MSPNTSTSGLSLTGSTALINSIFTGVFFIIIGSSTILSTTTLFASPF